MERAGLAAALATARGTGAAPQGGGPVVIAEADPQRFMASFAAAVAGDADVFLVDPAWGAKERAELAALLAAPRPDAVSRQPLGWLKIPSGGSSGGLKFACHDQDTLAAAVAGFTRHFGLARVNAGGVLPLHHVSGLMAWLRCALTGGDYRSLDWEKIAGGELPALAARGEGWVISLVPTQLDRLLRQAPATDWLRRFRIVFLGGAPAWPALLERAATAGLPVSTGYGMTETAAMVTALRPGEFLAGARDSGRTLPHATITLGSDGTILVGGTSLCRGYHPAMQAGTPFATGDLGALDARGHLTVLGRRDGVIITGGEKVQPAEVEAVLRGSGEFDNVVVLGLPDAEWGECVVAAFPAARAPDFSAVTRAVERELAAYKRPRHFVPIADWPLTAAGKNRRADVARQAAAWLAGSSGAR